MYGYKQWLGRDKLANLILTIVALCTDVGTSRPKASYPRPVWAWATL